jgi:hypothetical protein
VAARQLGVLTGVIGQPVTELPQTSAIVASAATATTCRSGARLGAWGRTRLGARNRRGARRGTRLGARNRRGARRRYGVDHWRMGLHCGRRRRQVRWCGDEWCPRIEGQRGNLDVAGRQVLEVRRRRKEQRAAQQQRRGDGSGPGFRHAWSPRTNPWHERTQPARSLRCDQRIRQK